jgi:hypothetical protein
VEVAKQEEPFVLQALQLLGGLGEVRQGEVDEGELVVEDALVLVFELDAVDDVLALRRVFVIEDEVEDADGVDGGELEVPVAALGLLLDGEGGVEDAAVFEEVLFGLLGSDDLFQRPIGTGWYPKHRPPHQLWSPQDAPTTDLLPG